jgi:Domain of unknown function (DUF4202)
MDLNTALAAIDAANAHDPNLIEVEGVARPRAEFQGIRATHWVWRLAPDAEVSVVLAARAHHLRRWAVARADYPDGRAGYHRWKRDARDAARQAIVDVLNPVGADHATIERVGALVNRDDLGRDRGTQLVEDAACLVFLETQYDELIDRLGEDKVAEAVRKTLKKMSPEAIAIAGEAVKTATGLALLGRVASGR